MRTHRNLPLTASGHSIAIHHGRDDRRTHGVVGAAAIRERPGSSVRSAPAMRRSPASLDESVGARANDFPRIGPVALGHRQEPSDRDGLDPFTGKHAKNTAAGVHAIDVPRQAGRAERVIAARQGRREVIAPNHSPSRSAPPPICGCPPLVVMVSSHDIRWGRWALFKVRQACVSPRVWVANTSRGRRGCAVRESSLSMIHPGARAQSIFRRPRRHRAQPICRGGISVAPINGCPILKRRGSC